MNSIHTTPSGPVDIVPGHILTYLAGGRVFFFSTLRVKGMDGGDG